MTWRTAKALASRAALLWLAAALFASLSAAAAETPAPRVVVSLKPIHSLVAGVMQGLGEPVLLVEGAGSPHSYSLRPSEARALREADLVFWIGAGMETFLVRALPALAGPAEVVSLSELPGLALLPLRAGGAWEAAAHEHEDDPQGAAVNLHLWLDPQNAARLVAAVAAALSRADPTHGERYHANGARLVARLQDLERELGATLAPVAAVPYIVFHDAYPYLERRYGLSPVGALSVSPERPPGARRLAEIRRRIRESGARCLFSEPQFEPALARTAVEGSRVRLGELDPLGTGIPAGPEAYFSMMRGLAAALAHCLRPAG